MTEQQSQLATQKEIDKIIKTTAAKKTDKPLQIIQVGDPRLDHALPNGLNTDGVYFIYGESFIGKELFAYQCALANCAQGIPTTILLTNQTIPQARRMLKAIDSRANDYENEHLITFIDAYTKQVQLETNGYVDALYADLDELLPLQKTIISHTQAMHKLHGQQTLIMDSLSPVMLRHNTIDTFTWLQTILANTKTTNTTTFLLLDEGMHAEADVQAIKHLANAMFHCSKTTNNNKVTLAGLPLTVKRDWLEYKHTETHYEITGSFAEKRVR